VTVAGSLVRTEVKSEADKFTIKAARRGSSRETRTDVLEIPSLFYFSRHAARVLSFSLIFFSCLAEEGPDRRVNPERSNEEMKRSEGGRSESCGTEEEEEGRKGREKERKGEKKRRRAKGKNYDDRGETGEGDA